MKRQTVIVIGVFLLGSIAAIAYLRSGLLNLPSVPGDITPETAGLSDLPALKETDDAIRGRQSHESVPAIFRAQSALGRLEVGEEADGVAGLMSAVRGYPTNLVLGNLLRMEIFNLKRKWLVENASRSELALVLPEYLNDQPVAFFRELVRTDPAREVKLQLALALVDHMLLFPALEIKAPSSVEAVEILSDVLSGEDEQSSYYVPALYARGLNYLYRPFNLVWPERIAAPVDAASKDLALAVAVGQKLGVGSDALRAELSLSLGDAYAKEGKFALARSWWQIANNMARMEKFRHRVFTRLAWRDEDVSEQLEAALNRQMEDLEHPLSDLRFMWR